MLPSQSMKSKAVLIALLMIITTIAGCAGDESLSEELEGTTWITIEESPGPGNFDWDSISVVTFNEDGTLEEAYFAHAEDGCDESLGLVPSEEDPGLCFMTMDLFGSETSSEDGMTWEVSEDGVLIVSSSTSFSGEEFDEEFCDMMWEYSLETEDYSTAAVVSWDDESRTCDITLRQWGKLILGDGTLVSHPLHRVMEGDSSDIACTLGVPWAGEDQEDLSWLVHEELISLCPEPVDRDISVWDCRIEMPIADMDLEDFEEGIEQHPGYPEWCGSPVPAEILVDEPGPESLDGSNSLLPPDDEIYGWVDEWGKWGRNATHYTGTWPGPDECNQMTIYDLFIGVDWKEDIEGEVGQWDEDLSLCATPVPCESEVDSQYIYEGCWPSPYARYYLTGDYLYVGHPSFQ